LPCILSEPADRPMGIKQSGDKKETLVTPPIGTIESS
jgi:hypothetical protein